MKIIKNLTLLVICICLFLDISISLCYKQAKVKNSSHSKNKSTNNDAIKRVRNIINRNQLTNKLQNNNNLKKKKSNKCINKVLCVTESDILEYKKCYDNISKTKKEITDSIISCRISFRNYLNKKNNGNLYKSNINKDTFKNFNESCMLNNSIVSCINTNNYKKNTYNSFLSNNFSNTQNLNNKNNKNDEDDYDDIKSLLANL